MPEPRPRGAFVGVSALLFAASAAATVAWCLSMSGMGEVPMPGGWTLSMAWMPMCGQTWTGAAASFVGMWAVMMTAMMLPSLVPMLWRYRLALGTQGETRLGGLTALMAAGYFFVWTVLGAIVFALGAAFAEAAMQMSAVSRAIPASLGMVVLLAGAFQFTAWKAHHLACCRQGQSRTLCSLPTPARHGNTACGRACTAVTPVPA